jgi:hypothetical protein
LCGVKADVGIGVLEGFEAVESGWLVLDLGEGG